MNCAVMDGRFEVTVVYPRPARENWFAMGVGRAKIDRDDERAVKPFRRLPEAMTEGGKYWL